MKLGNLVGRGNTATIYEWDEGKVLKLFVKGYPRSAAEQEFLNAKAIHPMHFAKPNAYEMIDYEEQIGILYDKVEGESLLEWVLRTGDVEGCATDMAELHQTMLQNKAGNVPDYKEFLRFNIQRASSANWAEKERMLADLESLEHGDALCHGDFHPGNILLANGKPTVIDFMNVCRGPMLYDVARTVYLIQYTPIPEGIPNADSLLAFKQSLTDLYLMKMKITREQIQDYIAVIRAARIGECPDEFGGENHRG